MPTDEPIEEIMQYFAYGQLPPAQQEISKMFADLAAQSVARTPRCPERTAGLRKLLEAKDCIVRASFSKPVPWRDRASGPVEAREWQPPPHTPLQGVKPPPPEWHDEVPGAPKGEAE